MSTKGCVGFFKFSLDLELFAKINKDPVFTHSFFYIFINKSRSKQNNNKKKNPKHPFLDIINWKACAKFQQKY